MEILLKEILVICGFELLYDLYYGLWLIKDLCMCRKIYELFFFRKIFVYG